MKIGQLIFHLPAEKKQKKNSIEHALKKNMHVFNRTCIKENLLQKYANIFTYMYIAEKIVCTYIITRIIISYS